MKTFSDLEARLLQVEEDLLLGAEKVIYPPFTLAYRKGDMLIVRDSSEGDLPQRDIVFNGWRVYAMTKTYHIQASGKKFLSADGRLVDRYSGAAVFNTEDEACDFSTQELAEKLNTIFMVCSSDELCPNCASPRIHQESVGKSKFWECDDCYKQWGFE